MHLYAGHVVLSVAVKQCVPFRSRYLCIDSYLFTLLVGRFVQSHRVHSAVFAFYDSPVHLSVAAY